MLPKLAASEWDSPPYSLTEQRTFADGRIVVTGNSYRRKAKERVDQTPFARIRSPDEGSHLATSDPTEL